MAAKKKRHFEAVIADCVDHVFVFVRIGRRKKTLELTPDEFRALQGALNAVPGYTPEGMMTE